MATHVRMLVVATGMLICVLLAGCGGLQRHLVYRPIVPVLEQGQGHFAGNRAGSWPLILRETELRIDDVVYASKLVWVFGPFFAFPTFWEKYVPREGLLEIGIFIASKPEASMHFDLREFMVLLEDGRSFPPNAVTQWGRNGFEAPGPVTLPGGEDWAGRLRYDLPLANMRPFELRLGALDVNGEVIRLPGVLFVRGRSYGGS